jgi:hypothetical protein
LLQVSYVRKLELFQRLETDIGTLVEADYISANAHDNNQSANERVKWAIKVVSEDKRYVDHMLEDLTASLNAVSEPFCPSRRKKADTNRHHAALPSKINRTK